MHKVKFSETRIVEWHIRQCPQVQCFFSVVGVVLLCSVSGVGYYIAVSSSGTEPGLPPK